jgi:hypothetical protein
MAPLERHRAIAVDVQDFGPNPAPDLGPNATRLVTCRPAFDLPR